MGNDQQSQQGSWDGVERRIGLTITKEQFQEWRLERKGILIGFAVMIIISLVGIIWRDREVGALAISANVSALTKQLDSTEKYFQAETARLDRGEISTKKDIEYIRSQITDIRQQISDVNKGIREISDTIVRIAPRSR